MDYSFRKVFGKTYVCEKGNEVGIGCQFFNSLKNKYNVFGLKKPYRWGDTKPQWVKALGNERVLDINNPKACIDIILGAIALTSGARTLEEYLKDMTNRGQSEERINEVVSSLTPYWEVLKSKTIIPIIKSNDTIDEMIVKCKNERLSKYKDIAILYDNIEEKLGENFPKEFKCPLSKKAMIDPVVCSDGMTFDRISIETLFQNGKFENPISGKNIDKDLVENVNLKALINDFVQKQQ